MHNDLILTGDMVEICYSDRTVVQGNDFSKAGHGPATWLCTTNDVIRRNVFHAEWGRLFSLFNCSPCLFEENILMENYHGGGSADPGSKILTIDGIIRRNVACRNWGYVVQASSYKLGDYPWWVLTGTRLYNNTFANNASYAWEIGTPADRLQNITNNVWKNNIFFGNTPSGGYRTFVFDGPVGEKNLWTRNVLGGEGPGAQPMAVWDAALSAPCRCPCRQPRSSSLKCTRTTWISRRASSTTRRTTIASPRAAPASPEETSSRARLRRPRKDHPRGGCPLVLRRVRHTVRAGGRRLRGTA